jgi:hypothetical protein
MSYRNSGFMSLRKSIEIRIARAGKGVGSAFSCVISQKIRISICTAILLHPIFIRLLIYLQIYPEA